MERNVRRVLLHNDKERKYCMKSITIYEEVWKIQLRILGVEPMLGMKETVCVTVTVTIKKRKVVKKNGTILVYQE